MNNRQNNINSQEESKQQLQPKNDVRRGGAKKSYRSSISEFESGGIQESLAESGSNSLQDDMLLEALSELEISPSESVEESELSVVQPRNKKRRY